MTGSTTHRELAGELFNRSWELHETENRAPEQDDELVHCVHASCHHWRQAGTPAQVARGENQCARVYAALGRAEPALHHAQRCLDLARAGGDGFEEWDLASAYEVMARAALTAGDMTDAAGYAARSRAELAGIADDEDRELIESQLAELGL
jgi:hypothetical protein